MDTSGGCGPTITSVGSPGKMSLPHGGVVIGTRWVRLQSQELVEMVQAPSKDASTSNWEVRTRPKGSVPAGGCSR